MHMDELEINDYPQIARQKITHRDRSPGGGGSPGPLRHKAGGAINLGILFGDVSLFLPGRFGDISFLCFVIWLLFSFS